MLLLTRKLGESIFIHGAGDGQTIEVRLLKVKGESAVIGFDAPKSVAIQRDDAKSEGGPDVDAAE